MRTFGAFEAKNRLSELLELVENGEEILITRHGKPVARLVGTGGGAPAKPGSPDVRRAIEELKRLGEQMRGSGLSWRELRDAGRKY